MALFKKPADIKVGVIGYSHAYNMGKRHLEQMQRAGMTPTAMAELVPALREDAARDFPGLSAYPSVPAMLSRSDVNLVAVITPHNTHARLALACLRAGRHVVCEKPFAVTTAECDAMIREARRRRLMLTTYHNRHWDGWILEAVRHIVRDGKIGEVRRIDAYLGGWNKPGKTWRSSKSISGGILYDWGVHFLEYALQLIPSGMTEVSGFATRGVWASRSVWKQDANEDEACAVVRFKNGACLRLRISSIETTPRQEWLEIGGAGGSYRFDPATYQLARPSGETMVVTRGKNPPPQGDAFYQNVAEHLTRGVPLVITPEWARRAIHILDLANRSARLGRALKAVYP